MIEKQVLTALDNAKANGYDMSGWKPEKIAAELLTYDAELAESRVEKESLIPHIQTWLKADPFNKLKVALESFGFKESGGGDNFTMFDFPSDQGVKTVYLFEGASGFRRGPDTDHWVELDDNENIIRGGFTVESIQEAFGKDGVR